MTHSRIRRRDRTARPPSPPRHRRPDRRVELSPPPVRRPRPGAPPLQSANHSVARAGTTPPRATTEKQEPRSPRRLITDTRQPGIFRPALLGKIQSALTQPHTSADHNRAGCVEPSNTAEVLAQINPESSHHCSTPSCPYRLRRAY